MNYRYLRVAPFVASALLLNACTDDNYDLGNIDTTSQIKVDNLTLPVNLKAFDLNTVIDVDDNDPNAAIQIREVDGSRIYAISKSGSFNAATTTIAKIHAPAPKNVAPSEVTIHGTEFAPSFSRRRLPSLKSMRYEITEKTTRFTYDAGSTMKIDESIKSVKRLDFSNDEPMMVDITYYSPDITDFAETIAVTDLQLIIPRGLHAYCIYEGRRIYASDGILTIPELSSNNGSLHVRVIAEYLDFAENLGTGKGIEVNNREFSFTENIGFKSGFFYAYPKSDISLTNLPDAVHFIGKYDISAFSVDKFSGNIEYATSIDPISGINLSDLPDFLDNDNNNIILDNPQIYLTVNNPVGPYGLSARSGITLQPSRNGVLSTPRMLEKFSIGNDRGEGPYEILMAAKPEAPSVDAAFRNATPYTFPGLSGLLGDNGIPQSISISLSSTKCPQPAIYGDALDFPLGSPLGSVSGKYTFYTPLALANGSMIVYSETKDGWADDSDDLDGLSISLLKINADVTTTVPASVTLRAWPVDKNGNRLDVMAQTTIPASASSESITLAFDGLIQDLDGIYFEAVATDFNSQALSPSQKIHLENLRATVTGSYTKDF